MTQSEAMTQMVKALENLIEIDRRDNTTDPDLTASDQWRKDAIEIAKKAVALAKSQPEGVPLNEKNLTELATCCLEFMPRGELALNAEIFIKAICAKFTQVKPEGVQWPEKKDGIQVFMTHDGKEGVSQSQMFDWGWNKCLEACKAKFTAPAPVKEPCQHNFISSGTAYGGQGLPKCSKCGEVKEPEQSEVQELAKFLFERSEKIRFGYVSVKWEIYIDGAYKQWFVSEAQAILNAGYRKGGGRNDLPLL